MRKNFLALAFLFPVIAQAANGTLKGDGTESNPWQVDDYEDLKAIGTGPYLYSNHYVLTDDIDASASENEMCNDDGCNGFISIGKKKDAADSTVFHGSIDGQNHTIRNLKIWLPCESSVGFISYLAGSLSNLNFDTIHITGRKKESNYVGVVARAFGPIRNVHVTNGFVQGNNYVGGIVGSVYNPIGYPDNGNLENVSFQGTVIGKSYVGGIAGNSDNKITSAKSDVQIIAYASSSYTADYIGGIAGFLEADLEHGSAAGNITVDLSMDYSSKHIYYVGGLVGRLKKGTISQSQAQLDISRPPQRIGNGLTSVDPFYDDIGGLVGRNDGTITTSYFIGNVEGKEDVGGIAGSNHGAILYVYSIGSVKGTKYVGGITGYQSDDGSIQYSYTATTAEADSIVGNISGNGNAQRISGSYWNSDYAKTADTVGKSLSSTEMKSLANFEGWKDLDDTISILCESESSPGFLQTLYQCGNDYSFSPIEGEDCQILHICNDIKKIWSIKEGKTFPYLAGNPRAAIVPIAVPTTASAWQESPKVASQENIDATLIGKWENRSCLNDIGDSIYHYYRIGYLDGQDSIWGTSSYMAVPNKIEIASLNDLKKIGTESSHPLSASYELVKDIDGLGTTIKPIGDSVSIFNGSFNGNNHAISNLNINDPHRDFTGLFGYVDKATIENLILKNIQVNASWCVGALAGEADHSIIRKVVSYNGNISGTEFVGGLIGATKDSRIDMVAATGNVSGTEIVGGVFGAVASVVNNVFSVSLVKGNENAGGVSGHIQSFNLDASLSQGYSASMIKSRNAYELSSNGWFSTGNFKNIFYDSTLFKNGKETSYGRTTEEMLKQATYENFDFDSIWTIQEGVSYPYFKGMDPILPGQVEDDGTANVLLGKGTEASPYLISDYDDLKYIGKYEYTTDLYYKLKDDIYAKASATENCDANGENCKGFEPIENFSGVFLGNNKTISLLTINRADEDSVGLFKALTETAKVSALHLDSISVFGKDYVGGLTGVDGGATLDSLEIRGSINGQNNVGAVAGEKTGGTLPIVTTAGMVLANNNAGGLFGSLKRAKVYDAMSTTSVSGESNLGGLMGTVEESEITNAIAVGKITGSKNIGNLAGVSTNTTWNSVYGDSTIWHQSRSTVGVLKHSAQLVHQETFENWDFTDTWKIKEGYSYPYLKWTARETKVFPQYVTIMDGSGTDEDPFLIKTFDDLASIGYGNYTMGSVYKLANDIENQDSVSTDYLGYKEAFVPVYGETEHTTKFSGKFHGAGHSITGIHLWSSSNSSSAFIDSLSESGIIDSVTFINFSNNSSRKTGLVAFNYGTIKNVTMKASAILGQYAGGISSSNYGTIQDSYFRGQVIADSIAGGIAAENWGTIDNCTVDSATIQGLKSAGGLVGIDHQITRNSKVTSGGVFSPSNYAGGAIGIAEGATISNVTTSAQTSNSSPIAVDYAGGFVGLNNGTIENSSATGTVINGAGFAGTNTASIKNCYAKGNVKNGFGFVTTNSGVINSSYTNSNQEWNYMSGTVAGGFAGINDGEIYDVYATGSILFSYSPSTGAIQESLTLSAMVAVQAGTLKNAYSIGSVKFPDGSEFCENRNWENAGENVYYNSSRCSMPDSIIGRTGLSESQMSHAENFKGFDFTNVWSIDEGKSFPTLRFHADTLYADVAPEDTTIAKDTTGTKDTTDVKDTVITGGDKDNKSDQDNKDDDKSIGSKPVVAGTSLNVRMNGDFAELQFTIATPGFTRFTIMDMRGSLVHSENLGARFSGSYSETLDLNKLQKGKYIGILQVNGRMTQRMVLLKK